MLKQPSFKSEEEFLENIGVGQWVVMRNSQHGIVTVDKYMRLDECQCNKYYYFVIGKEFSISVKTGKIVSVPSKPNIVMVKRDLEHINKYLPFEFITELDVVNIFDNAYKIMKNEIFNF